MKENWPIAIKWILSEEGGYTVDDGGETNYGISSKANPGVDIKNLTPEEASAIYKKKYWDDHNLDAAPSPLDIVLMDAYVNGYHFITQPTDWREFIFSRLNYYVTLASSPKYRTYLESWVGRMVKLHAYIKAAFPGG